MSSKFLPREADNTFPGYKLGLWLFGLLVLIKIAMSLNSIFNAAFVASSADGIPLSAFGIEASQTVVSLFAIWGLSQLVLALFGVVVLVRYRSLVPFMFGLLLFEQLGRRAILHVLPIIRSGTPPGSFVNVLLLAVTIAGLGLSLRTWGPGKGRAPLA
jgi:hypothetical protein